MTADQIAIDLIGRGMAVVPVPVGGKHPSLKQWQHLRITVAEVPRYFSGRPVNVGAIMGPASGGLTDIDLDCKEATALAPFLLPETHSIYGRPGKPRSHYLYTCPDPEAKGWIKMLDETKACVIELRLGGGGKGSQSVMPGSLHPSGERYEWNEDGERGSVACAVLKTAIVSITVGTIVIRHWPARGSRNDTALALGGFLARAGWSADTIEYFVTTICRVHGEADDPAVHGKTARNSAERYARGGQVYGLPTMVEIFGEPAARQMAKHLGYKARGDMPTAPTETDGLPVAMFGPLSKMADRAAEILLAASVPFYQRDTKLVRPVLVKAKTFHDQDTTVAQLVEVELPYMRDMLCRKSRWVKPERRTNSWVDIHPPKEAAETLLKRFGDWTFPQIDGIISTPTLRRDGSILSVAGYDPATRLLLVDPPPMPPIPDEPTEQEARTALKLLLDLLTEFPFVDEASKAAALSGYITPVCRAAFPLAPMHTADAPDAASGKSYLLNTAAAIATGQDMPVLGAGGDEQELGKRLDAALMQGQPLVCLDNMTSELGGGDLCRVVEQMRVQIRVLGLTKAVTVEPRGVTFFANGISLIIRGDFVRRTIRARLDARMDRPETKVFTGNPMQKIQTNRGAYIAAALTICRAYMVAGRPGLLPQLVSFGGWSDTVRSALVWLGQTDPVRTQDVSRAEDPETGTLMTLMTAWIGSFGMGRASATTAQMVIERINCRRPVDPRNPTGDWEYVDRDLRAAVLATLPPQARGQPNAVALGIWLRGRRNKRVNGLWIGSQAATSRDPVKWWVDNEMTEQQPGPTEPIF